MRKILNFGDGGLTDPSGTTRFEYDKWDNLVALIDAENQRTEFEYYADGKLKLERRPMGEKTHYEYDRFGRLHKILDAKNQLTEYGNDDEWRLETITRFGVPPSGGQTTVTLSYDDDGNLAGYTDGTTSATYTYDDMGRKLTETVNYGPFSKHFEYTYYGNGQKYTFTAPDNTVYTYNYGLNNELQSLNIPGIGDITIPEYTWNRPATVNYPGGVSRSVTYDALMRLESLSVTDSGGNPLLNYGYPEYDEVGNIITKTTEHGNYAYDYDPSSRLITVDNPVLDDETYTYDDVGNRLTASGTTGTWDYNLNNELLGIGGGATPPYQDVTYDYDDNGNLTEIRIAGSPVWTYVYDTANRLVHVEDGTGSIRADYYYDPFGRRLWKDVNGTRTYFFYSEEGLIAEYDSTGTELRSYGYKPDSEWTTDPLFLKAGSVYYWYQNDHLGTPQKLTDSSGAVVWSVQYTAFGKAQAQVETIESNLRFPGQYYDVETGLHYSRFRYYDPSTGRYLKPDLIESVNVYMYVANNPIVWADPLGLAKILIDLGHGDITWDYETSERDPVTGRKTVLNTTKTRTIPDAGGAYPHTIDISDCGTPGNFCEKNLVMSIGPELKRRLEELGHEVTLSRNGDWGSYEEAEQKRQNRDPSGQAIEWRILLAEQEAVDYIVSVHVNKTTGNHHFQVYYYSGSPAAAVFAEQILVFVEEENLFDKCEPKPTESGVGANEDPDAQPGDLDYIPGTLRILWKPSHQELIASVLLEVGDIGVQKSRDFWTDEEQIQRFIDRLVQGIQSGIEIIE